MPSPILPKGGEEKRKREKGEKRGRRKGEYVGMKNVR